jgi:hypothetical protein
MLSSGRCAAAAPLAAAAGFGAAADVLGRALADVLGRGVADVLGRGVADVLGRGLAGCLLGPAAEPIRVSEAADVRRMAAAGPAVVALAVVDRSGESSATSGPASTTAANARLFRCKRKLCFLATCAPG